MQYFAFEDDDIKTAILIVTSQIAMVAVVNNQAKVTLKSGETATFDCKTFVEAKEMYNYLKKAIGNFVDEP